MFKHQSVKLRLKPPLILFKKIVWLEFFKKPIFFWKTLELVFKTLRLKSEFCFLFHYEVNRKVRAFVKVLTDHKVLIVLKNLINIYMSIMFICFSF